MPMTGLQAGTSVPLTRWPIAFPEDQAELAGLPPLTIPFKHKTSSNYLLGLPAMKALIGEYPPDLFFLLESRNPLPPELSCEQWPVPPSSFDISRREADRLVSIFFSTAHHAHPILGEDEFRAIYDHFWETGPDSSANSALCMVVFALGTVAASDSSFYSFDTSPPGMKYMQQAMPALISLSSWSFSYTLILPQALVLASVYFAYIVRPLQSWRLIYSASTILQFKLSGYVPSSFRPMGRSLLVDILLSSTQN